MEAWVAALFLDLTDADPREGRHGGEEGDDTEYPGKYIAEVLKTCRVQEKRLIFFKKWRDRDKVSDIVWCLETLVTPSEHEDVFPDVSTPLDVKERAKEPSDWSPGRIRIVWLKNLKTGVGFPY